MEFEKDDVVIYFRCADDIILRHDEYGAPAFSCYQNIPKTSKRIFIIGDQPIIHSVPICLSVQKAFIRYIQNLNSNFRIFVTHGNTQSQDYASLVFAPTLFLGPSSFGLAAGMANNGTVYSTPLYPSWTFENPHWKFCFNTPVLFPHIGKENNLSLDRPDEIIRWLETH